MPDSFESVHDLFKSTKDTNAKLEYLFDGLAAINKKLDKQKETVILQCATQAENCHGKFLTRTQGIIGLLIILVVILAIEAGKLDWGDVVAKIIS